MEQTSKANIKKRVVAIAMVLALLSVMATGTLAYFNAKGHAHNVITTAGVDVSLVEYQTDDQGTRHLYPTDPITGVVPGAEISKEPVAKIAEGSAPSWVRLKVQTSVVSKSGGELDPSVVTLDFNDDAWEYNPDDGWWYLLGPALEPRSESTPLFNSVLLDADMGNKYKNCTIDVDVFLEAVQAAHNGDSAREASGWPSTEGGEE